VRPEPLLTEHPTTAPHGVRPRECPIAGGEWFLSSGLDRRTLLKGAGSAILGLIATSASGAVSDPSGSSQTQSIPDSGAPAPSAIASAPTEGHAAAETVYVFNVGSRDVTLIDVAAQKVRETRPLGASIRWLSNEQTYWDGARIWTYDFPNDQLQAIAIDPKQVAIDPETPPGRFAARPRRACCPRRVNSPRTQRQGRPYRTADRRAHAETPSSRRRFPLTDPPQTRSTLPWSVPIRRQRRLRCPRNDGRRNYAGSGVRRAGRFRARREEGRRDVYDRPRPIQAWSATDWPRAPPAPSKADRS